jgi:hypothetical protein
MKKLTFCFTVFALLMLLACKKQDLVITQYHSETEKIEVLVNFSLLDIDSFDKYVVVPNDDAVVLKLILDYNLVNDKAKFAGTNGEKINGRTLKEKLLMLSNNL